jgi:hypothetical protein
MYVTFTNHKIGRCLIGLLYPNSDPHESGVREIGANYRSTLAASTLIILLFEKNVEKLFFQRIQFCDLETCQKIFDLQP